MRVVSPRVSSSEASRSTVRRRSSEMSSVREAISGGSATIQLKDELKTLTDDERKQILQPVCHIIPQETLAMKADLLIPWNKMRIMRRCVSNLGEHTSVYKIHTYNQIQMYMVYTSGIMYISRWMKAQGINLASERSIRAVSREILGENLAAEEVLLSQPLRFGVDMKLAPMVYVPDLAAKIMQLLDQNYRYGRDHKLLIYREA